MIILLNGDKYDFPRGLLIYIYEGMSRINMYTVQIQLNKKFPIHDFVMDIHNKNFYHLILRSLQENQTKTLLQWQDRSFTGKEIIQEVDAIRNSLNIQNVKTGDYVLIARSLGYQTLFVIISIMAHGAVPVLPPAGASFRQMVQLIRRLSVRWIVVQDEPSLISKVLLKISNVNILQHFSPLRNKNDDPTPVNLSPETPALVTHSSGSTGKSKSIVRSHGVLTAQHEILKKVFPPTPNQKDFPLFPAVLLHNLASGTTSVIPHIHNFSLLELDPEKIIAQLKSQSITTLTGNVFYFNSLIRELNKNNGTLSFIKMVGVGGSPVPESLTSKLSSCMPNATVYIIYGSSEAEPITIRKVGSKEKETAGYFVGEVAPDTEIKIDEMGDIDDGNKKILVGEILVKGKHVVLGNAEWYRTGDFGYITDGKVFLTARAGNQRIIHGVQQYQIEHLISTMPDIENVAAIARVNHFDTYFSGNANLLDIQKKLMEHFPTEIIGAIKHLSALPMDSRHFSKVLYSKLPA